MSVLAGRDVVLSDGSQVHMSMVSMSSDARLVWGDDVAMFARGSYRVPLQRCYTVSYADLPYWLKVRTRYAVFYVTCISDAVVELRIVPTPELVALDPALSGVAFVSVDNVSVLQKSYWYSLLYGLGQLSRW